MTSRTTKKLQDIPQGWNLMPLGATALPGRDNFVDGDWIEAEFITNEGIRLVQTGNVGVGQFIERPDFRKFISPASFQHLGCKWVYPGDLLICRLADPIGRVCEVPVKVGRCVTAVDCTIFRVNENILTKRFALHLLNTQEHLTRLSDMAGGSTRQRISRGNLATAAVLLPPVTEQEGIADILDANDDAIAYSDAVIAKLRLMKAGLMHDLLTRGLADCGRGAIRGTRTADSADLSLGAETVAEFDIPLLRDPVLHSDQFKNTPFGLVPKCWDVRRLDDVGTWVSGGTPSKSNTMFWDGDIPWVTPKDMKVFALEHTTDYLTPAGAASGSRIAPAGSIFIVVRGMILAHTFPVCMAPRAMAFNQDIKAIIPNDGVDSAFLGYWFLNAAKKMLGLTTEATHGTKRFDMADIYACQIALPHPNEQSVIVNILDAHDARLRAEEAYRNKLILQKQGLMTDLLTGRVRLST